MNKPYTCHNCGTVFELVSQDCVDQKILGPDIDHLSGNIKIKCPGCYYAGFTLEQSIYTIKIDDMSLVKNNIVTQ